MFLFSANRNLSLAISLSSNYLNQTVMIKVLGFIMTIAGAIALILGVLEVFGSMSLGISPWPLIILGVVFFFAGIGLLKYRKDTDVIDAENS